MLPVLHKNLEPNSYRQLEKWQNQINAEITFELQSNKAKSLWNKHSTLTFKDIKEKLSEMCPGHKRCVYCEDSYADEIEHIYPKDLFPDRSFNWENYIYACGPCNGPKNNKFALIQLDDSILDITPIRNQPTQQPPNLPAALIDPRVEDPMRFLEIDIFGTFFYLPKDGLDNANKNKATYTIKVLRLNARSHLVSSRASAYHSYMALADYYGDLKHSNFVEQSILDGFVNIINLQNWPSVWFEMKRNRLLIPELDHILNLAPELI